MSKGERLRPASVNETALSGHHSFLALKVSGERYGLRILPHRGAPGRTQPLWSPRGPSRVAQNPPSTLEQDDSQTGN